VKTEILQTMTSLIKS